MEIFTEKFKDGRNILRKGITDIFHVGFGRFFNGEAIDKLAEYEELEEQGKLLKLPVAIGDVVYVIAECESIPEQLDGTLYGENGEPGTATGYYCPYEDNCPFDDEDFEDCDKYKNQKAVFEDYVHQISINEFGGIDIFVGNCSMFMTFEKDLFLTREQAEQKLKEENNG